MDKKTKNKKSTSRSPQMSECPAGLELIKTGVIGCLPDEPLTILWANTGFYLLAGYTAKDFYKRFQSLEEYYNQLPDDYAAIRQAVMEADSDIELTIRLPRQTDGFSWVHLLGTITINPTDKRRIVQLEFTNVSKLAAEKEEQVRLCEEQQLCFRSVLDTYEGCAYISDMDTYELLYVNQTSCGLLGAPSSKVVGQKCYEMIQGRTSPCPFCTNDKLCREEFYRWEFFNPSLERTFMIRDLEINWEGHRARLELSHDTFSAEYKKGSGAGCTSQQYSWWICPGRCQRYADSSLVWRRLSGPDRLYKRTI